MNWTKKVAKWTVAVLAVVLLAIQLVPIDRTNPSIETEVPAPAAVARQGGETWHGGVRELPPADVLPALPLRQGRPEDQSSRARLRSGSGRRPEHDVMRYLPHERHRESVTVEEAVVRRAASLSLAGRAARRFRCCSCPSRPGRA